MPDKVTYYAVVTTEQTVKAEGCRGAYLEYGG